MKKFFPRGIAHFLIFVFLLLAVASSSSCAQNTNPTLKPLPTLTSPDEDQTFSGQASASDPEATTPDETPFTPVPGSNDKTPPFLAGNDVQFEIGSEIDYASLVFVSDDQTEEPRLVIDASAVNPDADGVYPVHYTAYDEAGNKTTLTIQITIKDTVPPTITGEDFSVKVGGSVSYKSKVTVSDNHDPSPTLTIDNSTVDLDKPGVYSIIYTATDASGNRAVLTLKLTVKGADDIDVDTPEGRKQYVIEKSREILAEITTPDMNEMQVAYAIYHWTKHKISYSSHSNKDDYITGAYEGFKTRTGDCYTYYATSKALLEAAGIDNVDMVKERTSSKQARHYWLLINVGSGWYHFDSTPYIYKESNFFMVTDAELKKWDDKYYRYCHNFKDEGLPERATESVQALVNYHSSTLKLPEE